MHTPAIGAPAVSKRYSGPTPKHAVNPLGSVAMVVGALAGYLAMNALSPAAKGRVIGGAIAGTIIGLLPFFVGRHVKQPKLAARALTCCCVAGIALGMVLAGPVALIFTLVLVSRRPQG